MQYQEEEDQSIVSQLTSHRRIEYREQIENEILKLENVIEETLRYNPEIINAIPIGLISSEVPVVVTS